MTVKILKKKNRKFSRQKRKQHEPRTVRLSMSRNDFNHLVDDYTISLLNYTNDSNDSMKEMPSGLSDADQKVEDQQTANRHLINYPYPASTTLVSCEGGLEWLEFDEIRAEMGHNNPLQNTARTIRLEALLNLVPVLSADHVRAMQDDQRHYSKTQSHYDDFPREVRIF